MRDGIEIEMSQQKSDLSLEDLNNTYADRCKHLWESNQELELKTIMLNVKKIHSRNISKLKVMYNTTYIFK